MEYGIIPENVRTMIITAKGVVGKVARNVRYIKNKPRKDNMHVYTESQIKDCETLSKLIEQKTGVKREPKVGETWVDSTNNILQLVAECYLGDEYYEKCFKFLNENKFNVLLVKYLLFPLYSHGELLEMILDKMPVGAGQFIALGHSLLQGGMKSISLHQGDFELEPLYADCEVRNLLSALLKLAIETEG